MVKIVIFVVIVALAGANAQNFAFAGFPTGGVFDIFKGMKMLTPEDIIKQQNMKVLSPDELINRRPGSGEQIQAHYVKSQSTGDGKVLTTIFHNNNGEKTGYTLTN